eukprot:TRINITY_DN1830_c0_g1_i1.p1 TRINITY_DN1830_c0_g1~~TRINITY_DN1830_c0_g1_i1.p1  ORF type:complete len:581 (+),score=98.22 TRINITY_DN1830_c0_g1_i1:38-1744(+)
MSFINPLLSLPTTPPAPSNSTFIFTDHSSLTKRVQEDLYNLLQHLEIIFEKSVPVDIQIPLKHKDSILKTLFELSGFHYPQIVIGGRHIGSEEELRPLTKDRQLLPLAINHDSIKASFLRLQLQGAPEDYIFIRTRMSAAERHLLVYRFPCAISIEERPVADQRQVGIFSRFKDLVRTFSAADASQFNNTKSYAYGDTEFNCTKKNWLGFEENCTIRFESDHIAMRDFTEFYRFLPYTALKDATLVIGQDLLLSLFINQEKYQFYFSSELVEKFVTLLANKASSPISIIIQWKGLYYAESRPSSKVFGVPINEIIERGETIINGVPAIVHNIIKHIEKKGLTIEGIFRLPGSHGVVQQIEKDINNGIEVDITKFSIHDVCTLLKDYFRSLPQPLFPAEWSMNIFQLMRDHKNSPDLVRRVRSSLESLPVPNVPLLRRLMQLLVKVNQNALVNKMDTVNLAKIWSPNLFPNASSIILAHGVGMVSILRMMIDQYDSVFMHRNSFDLNEKVKEEEELMYNMQDIEAIPNSAPADSAAGVASSTSPSTQRMSRHLSKSLKRRTLELSSSPI